MCACLIMCMQEELAKRESDETNLSLLVPGQVLRVGDTTDTHNFVDAGDEEQLEHVWARSPVGWKKKETKDSLRPIKNESQNESGHFLSCF